MNLNSFATVILLFFSVGSISYAIVSSNMALGTVGYFTMLYIVFIAIRDDLGREDEYQTRTSKN